MTDCTSRTTAVFCTTVLPVEASGPSAASSSTSPNKISSEPNPALDALSTSPACRFAAMSNLFEVSRERCGMAPPIQQKERQFTCETCTNTLRRSAQAKPKSDQPPERPDFSTVPSHTRQYERRISSCFLVPVLWQAPYYPRILMLLYVTIIEALS